MCVGVGMGVGMSGCSSKECTQERECWREPVLSDSSGLTGIHPCIISSSLPPFLPFFIQLISIPRCRTWVLAEQKAGGLVKETTAKQSRAEEKWARRRNKTNKYFKITCLTFKKKSPKLAKNDCILQDSKPLNDKTSEKGSDGSTGHPADPSPCLRTSPFHPLCSNMEQKPKAAALSQQALNHTAAAG